MCCSITQHDFFPNDLSHMISEMVLYSSLVMNPSFNSFIMRPTISFVVPLDFSASMLLVHHASMFAMPIGSTHLASLLSKCLSTQGNLYDLWFIGNPDSSTNFLKAASASGLCCFLEFDLLGSL